MCSLILQGIDGHTWTLGKYIESHGGNKNRGKKVWGVYIPVGAEEEGEDEYENIMTADSVSLNSHSAYFKYIYL